MMRGTFYRHLSEAIVLNVERRPYYASRTGGRSRALSTALVAAEWALLPFAALVDASASYFHRYGIPIVQNDFVSMRAVAPVETPPRHTGTMSTEERAQLLRRMRHWRRSVFTHLLHADLDAVCHESDELLALIADSERDWQVHLAMCHHLVESTAYAALHGIEYAARSNGRTRTLTQLLVGGQALVAPWGVRLDARAQELHRTGIGILVNDLPAIPFRGEWHAHGTEGRVTNEQ